MEAAQCRKDCTQSLHFMLQLPLRCSSATYFRRLLELLKVFQFLKLLRLEFQVVNVIHPNTYQILGEGKRLTKKQKSEIPSWTNNKHLCHKQMDHSSDVQNTKKDV